MVSALMKIGGFTKPLVNRPNLPVIVNPTIASDIAHDWKCAPLFAGASRIDAQWRVQLDVETFGSAHVFSDPYSRGYNNPAGH
jgi:hypothetical protein